MCPAPVILLHLVVPILRIYELIAGQLPGDLF